MAIDPGENFSHFLQNFHNYRYDAWYIANRDLSDHEYIIESLATMARTETSDSETAVRYIANGGLSDHEYM